MPPTDQPATAASVTGEVWTDVYRVTAGLFERGDFLRVLGGNVHIATSCGYDRVWMACGGGYSYQAVKPATGDEPGQCAKCWEAM